MLNPKKPASPATGGELYCPNGCGQKYRSKCNLNRHLRYGCELIGRKSSGFGRYVLTADDGNLICPNDICGRRFKSERCLNHHLKNQCGIRGFKCDHCDRVFDRKSNCKRHMKDVHKVPNNVDAGINYFLCPRNCGRRYKHKFNLNVHLKYECGVPKQFKCGICEKAFALKGAHKKHMMKDFYVCPNHCGRHYKTKHSLKRHLDYECGVPKKFKCEICKRAFSQRAHQKVHMLNVHKVLV
ncbi:hypothetical protein V9T40_010896 [Parthenolecanium corni]|uniref:C2H2-type domain-containing protein n=1 Tax=Parthenolecanium corni TaxID=536013 RepID=A0AAN9T510_9HEMI